LIASTATLPHARSLWRLPPLAKIGWFLYVVSLLCPASAHANFIGAFMLVVAPMMGFKLLFSGAVRGALLGISLLAGFAANGSLFMRTPVWLRVGASIAPWLTYAASLFAFGTPDAQRMFANAFFFPWALGIGLVNLVYIRRRIAI